MESPTGSGKTLAFAIPLVELIAREPPRAGNGVGTLVLAPTRELASQVAGVFRALLPGAEGGAARPGGRRPSVRVVHGGVAVDPQALALRGGADVLVATPGRLLDLVSRNAARLGSVSRLVLDEADRVLALGFRDELSAVLARLPAERQTLLFSATMDAGIEALAAAALRRPERLFPGGVAPRDPASTPGGAAPGGPAPAGTPSDPGIEELVHLVPRADKGPFLRRLIQDAPGLDRILVFASSTRRADNVTRKLLANGVSAAAFHGDLSQSARTAALEGFRSGVIRVLVASDLASRGLDIEGLPCVVNYELPRAPGDYVHRIGRTGRAGGRGLAISLVSPEEEETLRLFEKRLGRRLPRAT